MPLAAKIRPTSLNEFIGQEKLVGKSGSLAKLITNNFLPSMIFWGPPGVGKTTLAEIISQVTNYEFLKISAVIDGKDSLKKVIAKAKINGGNDKKTILFIDEIHRWNKSQQDALLPYVESGEITLIGATTENPSFSIISPLLSRTRVFVFEPLSEQDILVGLKRGLEFLKKQATQETLNYLAQLSNGDLRLGLNSLEIASQLTDTEIITNIEIKQAVNKFLRYDKNGDEHYNIISALHKSIRSSDATAGVYWLLRMLEAGEDPLYIARRLIRLASEDIGNSNPNALLLANQVYDTCQKIGMPECNVSLVQLVEYLANCKKNNSSYLALKLAQKDVKRYGNLEVPLHLRNAPTELMKELGYSKGYIYDHDLANKKSDQQCLPVELIGRDYFKPTPSE